MVCIRGSGEVLFRLFLAVLPAALFLVYSPGIARAGDGDIGSVIDTVTFDATKGWEPRLVHVSGNYYAIAYSPQQTDLDIVLGTEGYITIPDNASLELEDKFWRARLDYENNQKSSG